MAESAFAQHIIASIRNELSLLKAHNYIQGQAYDDILRLLPRDINNRDTASYNSLPPSFPGGMIPTPSPTQSTVSTPAAPPSYSTAANGLGSIEALYDYNGQNPSTDLSFHRGDIIQLTEMINDDWWKGSLNGKVGIFPRTYVKKIDGYQDKKTPPPPPPPARDTQRDSYGYSPQPPKQQNTYSYPPPPQQQNSYGAPPPAQSNNSYAPPPAQSNSYAPPPQSSSYGPPPAQPQQQMTYAPPPVQQVASTSSAPAAVEQPHEENKMSSFGKKLAGNVANAATWGFGATLGSDVAHSIF